MLTSTCIKVTTTNFHPITAGNNRCVCQMCTSIPGVPQQQRHKPAYQVGLPSLILMPWGSRSHVRNLLKIHHTGMCKKPLTIPSHWHLQQSTTPGPQYLLTSTLTTISVPKEMSLGYSWRERKTLWGRWASSSHILLAALWRRARLFTKNRRDRGISLWIFFTNYENRLFQKQTDRKLLCTCLHGDEKQRTEPGVTFSELRACKC